MAPRGPSQALLRAALRTQPDRRLVMLSREQDQAAGEEIVRRYRQPLVRFAASIVPPQRAEDVVHDALGRALGALDRGEEVQQLRPWLYSIVRNAALNDLRDQPPPHELIDENYDGVEQPPQAHERRTRLRDLVAAMQRLPPTQRQALVKRELEGRSHDDIAVALGVSPGSARQLIYRARATLRQGMGSLLPMPLLRLLAESGGDGATVGAAAGGGAVATKAAVALIAAGAVVGGGLVGRDASNHQREGSPPAAQAAIVPSPLDSAAATIGPATGSDRVQVGAHSPGSAGHRGDGRSDSGHDSGPSGGDSHGPGGGEEAPSDSGNSGRRGGSQDDSGDDRSGSGSDGSTGEHSGQGDHGGDSGSSDGDGGSLSSHGGSGSGSGSDDGHSGGGSGSGSTGDGLSPAGSDATDGSSGSGTSDGPDGGGSSGEGSGEEPVPAPIEAATPEAEGTASADSRDSGSGDGS